MQSVSSRIWTRVAVSISNDDNDYTTGTSIKSIEMNIIIFFSDGHFLLFVPTSSLNYVSLLS